MVKILGDFKMDNLLLNLKNFMELTRFYSLNMTLGACFIIFSYAFYSEKFSVINLLLLIIALCFVHLGANLFDCYIDVKTKLNQGYNFENMRFSLEKKARLIRNGTYSLNQVKFILALLFSIALLIGIYFAFVTDWKVLIFALVGGILTLFYPISSKYYLSEITVGLIFGPLMIMGGYYALSGAFNSSLFLLSWAIFLTTIILLHTHNIMDWEYDEQENKNTLARMLKTKKKAITALKWMMILAYYIVVFGVLKGMFNPYMLCVFLTLPIATKLNESIKDYINIKDVKFEPRWYWGIFENWKQIREERFDFFMFRFYLARNFSSLFAILAAIGAMI